MHQNRHKHAPPRGCRIFILILVLAVFSLSGCAINPVTNLRDFALMTEAEEIALGEHYHRQFLSQYQLYDDDNVQSYVNGIGQNIATLSHRSHLNYQFTVVDSPELNAFASPGGYIYVTRGILAYLNSEAELAAVLAHEVGHVAARHGVRKDALMKIPGFLGKALFNHIGFGIDKSFNQIVEAKLGRYSRAFEVEADSLAVEYLVRSGYAPDAMSRVIAMIRDKEEQVKQLASVANQQASLYHGFHSHPDSIKRQALVDSAVHRRILEMPKGRDPNQEDYIRRLNGLVYGPAKGTRVIDGKYLQAATRSGLEIPAGWHVNSDSKILQLVSPNEEAVIQVLSKPHVAGISARTHLHRLLISDELTDEEALQGIGIKGWMARSTKQTENGEIPIWLATWVVDDVVQVVVATANDAEQHAETITACIRSFHKLGDAELRLTQPRRIGLIRAEAGTTYRQLAASSPLGKTAEQQLRLINGQTDPDEEPRAGSLLKIIR